MADQEQPNIERALEADIEQLAAEAKMHRERPEMQGVSGHEIIKESLRTIAPPAPPVQAQEPQNVFQNPLPAYAADAPAEAKLEVERLLEMAFHDGILKANAAAKRSGNAFIIDTFHDTLAGKLYPELKKRGIVE